MACSSGAEHLIYTLDTFRESDQEEMTIVGLDSLCIRHLFYSKSDFIAKIAPIKPYSIQGIGGDIKAIGIGKHRTRFYNTDGMLHDKILDNAYYAPSYFFCSSKDSAIISLWLSGLSSG